MFSISTIVFLTGVLLLIGIASSKFASRVGMPVLVLFLGVGMMAGSEGIGGLAFEDYGFANSIGSVALALILFDGGLRTSMESVRAAWKPALTLSTLGVLLTSGLTGAAAALILGVPILHGMLLGAIVGSTDAAAVFSILRTSGLRLPEHLTSTLEVESGSNDPMAIFLTVSLIAVLTGDTESPGALFLLFALQFGVGGLAGIGVGRLAAWTVNKIQLDYPGLYPILALAFGLLSFGLAAVLGGSGFLAVYLAGIVLGNSPIVFQRGIFMFHDAAAWLGQIVLFVMLGLLSFPTRLLSVTTEGILIALALFFVARPIAVYLSTLPFRFNTKELLFLSWVGLKGAVPITLATFPLMAGVPGSDFLFDVVFFVVLLSAITQGWSLPVVARWLGIGEPSDSVLPVMLEINALRHVDGQIVEYTVAPSARVAGQALRNLALPDGVVMPLIIRENDVIMPRGGTVLKPGDHVFAAMRTRLKPLIDRLFDPYAETPPLPSGLTLQFHTSDSVGQLHRFFGIPGPTWSNLPVGSLVEESADDEPARLGPFLIKRSDDPDFVTLTYAPEPEPPPAPDRPEPAPDQRPAAKEATRSQDALEKTGD